jgi:ferrous iron transport protein B
LNPLATSAPKGSHEPLPTIALVGRQNAGKTSLLMHLTGSSQRPINFPGSSVERTEARVDHQDRAIRFVDLPGITSLEPLSPDEAVALDWLRGSGEADVICAVLDAGKLAVELTLLEGLAQLGRPIIVALTKTDVAPVEVDIDALSKALGLPVVVVNALSGEGRDALLEVLVAAVGQGHTPLPFSPVALAKAVTRPRPSPPTLTDRLDRVLLHRILGLPILGLIVFGIFELLFVGAEPFVGLIEDGQAALSEWVSGLLEPGALQSFLVDGLINGIGSVLVFLPQIIFLVILITLLEASGYMARAAFLLDRVLSRVGLSGRSFVPMASAFACAVPAILGTRMIDNERERLATIAVLPLMSCSARLPVYVVLIGAFFPTEYAGLVLFGLYALGILVAALVAYILRKTRLRGEHSILMMELPVYQRPTLRVVFGQVRAASREFVVSAGTIIMATAVAIWALSYYPRPASIAAEYDGLRDAKRAELAKASIDALEAELAVLDVGEKNAYSEQSLLARAGKFIAPIFEPAGFDWRTTVGVLAAFPARELIIPTLGILYNEGDVDPGTYDLGYLDTVDKAQSTGLEARLRAARHEDGRPVWSLLTALSVMVFFALCSQCMATLGAIRRETRSWRWPVFVFSYMTALAWIAATLVYQVGSALGFGA